MVFIFLLKYFKREIMQYFIPNYYSWGGALTNSNRQHPKPPQSVKLTGSVAQAPSWLRIQILAWPPSVPFMSSDPTTERSSLLGTSSQLEYSEGKGKNVAKGLKWKKKYDKFSLDSVLDVANDLLIQLWHFGAPCHQCTAYNHRRRKSLMSTFSTLILCGPLVTGGAANVTTQYSGKNLR